MAFITPAGVAPASESAPALEAGRSIADSNTTANPSDEGRILTQPRPYWDILASLNAVLTSSGEFAASLP